MPRCQPRALTAPSLSLSFWFALLLTPLAAQKDAHATVRQKLGAAAKELADDAADWNAPGLMVSFDAAGAVSRPVVSRR